LQGADSPLPEREASSPTSFSSPLPAEGGIKRAEKALDVVTARQQAMGDFLVDRKDAIKYKKGCDRRRSLKRSR